MAIPYIKQKSYESPKRIDAAQQGPQAAAGVDAD